MTTPTARRPELDPPARAGRSWEVLAQLVAVLTVVAGTAAWLLDRRGLVVPIGIAGAVLLAGCLIALIRTSRRAVVIARIIETTTPIVGRDPRIRRPVRVHSWQAGKPTDLTLFYPPTWDDGEPKNRGRVLAGLHRNLGLTVAGEWDTQRDRVRLRAVDEPEVDDEGEALPKTDTDRVTALGRKMIGPATHVTTSETDDAGRLTAFTLRYPPHPALSIAERRDGFARALTQPLPGEWQVDWNLQGDQLTARRRPALTTLVPYPLPPLDQPWFLRIGQGRGLVEPVGWNLAGSTPHALITGETGGGKTTAFLAITVEALRRGIPVWGLDPKMIELMSLEGWPGFDRLATSPAEMAQMLTDAHALMMRRYQLIRTRQLRRGDLWPLVLLLDELLIAHEELNDFWIGEVKPREAELNKTRDAGEKVPVTGSSHPSWRLIMRMAALARSARIHLVIGVQRPQATLFPEGSRDNFRMRVSFGRLTQEGAMQMWGNAITGTDLPAGVPGRATLWTPDQPIESQIYRLPELDLHLGDDQLTPEDAELRRRIYAECAAGLARRPLDALRELDSAPVPPAADVDQVDQVDVDQPVPVDQLPTAPINAEALNVGDQVVTDLDGQPVEASITAVNFDDSGTVDVDFLTSTGQTWGEQLRITEKVQLRTAA